MSASVVLIVDDDAAICRLLEEALTDWGIQAKSVTNPLLVADEVRETFYNLILLNVLMPQMHGMDVLANLREFCPHTKVIILTGYAGKDIAIDMSAGGPF